MKKAQSVNEYAIVLAIVAAAIIGMQIYVKRGVQGRIRDLADQLSPAHYEDGTATSNFTTQQHGTTVQRYTNGLSETIQDSSIDARSRPETTTRWGSQSSMTDMQQVY